MDPSVSPSPHNTIFSGMTLMTLLSVGAKLDFSTLSGDVNSVLLFDFWTTGVQNLVGT